MKIISIDLFMHAIDRRRLFPDGNHLGVGRLLALMRRMQVFSVLLLALFVAVAQYVSAEPTPPDVDATLSVSENRTKLLLGKTVLLDAQADGFNSIHDIKYSPMREHFLVIACGLGCTQTSGFLFKADGGGKRRITAPWEAIFQSTAEWSEDGRSVFYYRIRSTGAEPPKNAPRRGWVQVDVKTGKKSSGVTRSLKLTATYGVLSLSGGSVLTVHAQPESKAKIVGAIPSYAKGIKVTGFGVKVGREVWAPVKFQDISGWVNQDYLFEESGTG